MNFSHYMRIERKERSGSRHYVVHVGEPKFTMELELDREAPDKIGRGIIRRVSLPNSWAGDYGRCAQALSTAQEFFRQSFGEPTAKREPRRFRR
jgi:hypothetical protein